MRRIFAVAGLVALVVSLVLIAILVVATLAVEIDRLPDDPGNGPEPRHAPLDSERKLLCLVLCGNPTGDLTRGHPTSLVFPLAFPLSKPFVTSWLQS